MGMGLSSLQRNESKRSSLFDSDRFRLRSNTVDRLRFRSSSVDLRKSTLSQHRNSMIISNQIPEEGSGNLSVRQIKAIQASWSKLNVDPKRTGKEIFLRFFAVHPYYMKYFPSFKTKTLASLENSFMLKAHGISVIYAFTTLVENLSDPHYFVKFMKQSVKVHHGRGISIKQYQEILTVLIDYMEEHLGDQFDPFTRTAWRRFAMDFAQSVATLRHSEGLPPVSVPYDVMAARQRLWDET